MKRVFTSLIIILATLLSFASCKKENVVEYCELGIILDKDFEVYDTDGAFNVAYSNGKTMVGITRLSFVDCEEQGFLSTFTPRKLAEVYLGKLGKQIDGGIEVHGDVPYFTYTDVGSDGSSYFYMPTFYRTPYAYFIITFITPKAREAEGRVEFLQYVSTVHILEEYL